MNSMFLMLGIVFLLMGCNHEELVKKTIGNNKKVSPSEVISLGRDDDDGKAKKWHIGGGVD